MPMIDLRETDRLSVEGSAVRAFTNWNKKEPLGERDKKRDYSSHIFEAWITLRITQFLSDDSPGESSVPNNRRDSDCSEKASDHRGR